MKTSKDMILEFVREQIYSKKGFENGIETKDVAKSLNMQRSNVSTALNELVKEGKLEKSSTRPVLYSLATQKNLVSEDSCFNQLIGQNGSLRTSIQLAKAAILYPNKSLNIGISAKPGCGSSSFATLIYQFAKESRVLSQEAPFVKVSLYGFRNNAELIDEALFGKNGNLKTSSFEKARNGVLFIDKIEYLNAKQISRIHDFLDTGRVYDENHVNFEDYSDVILIVGGDLSAGIIALEKMPIFIELPELKDRPMDEVFELVNYFFSIEANNSKRSIEVTIEAIEALLLAEYSFNAKELALSIKVACANAYVRVVDNPNSNIQVCLDDFKPQVRKGLLKKKTHGKDLSFIENHGSSIFYDKDTGYQKYSDFYSDTDIYSEINSRYSQMMDKGIKQSSIEQVINTHIENLYYRFYHTSNGVEGINQLEKIVDPEIVRDVQTWMDSVAKRLNREFNTNVFYGLCLHINALLTSKQNLGKIGDEQAVSIITDFPEEFAASSRLADLIKFRYNQELKINDIALITMFLVKSDEDEQGKVKLLYIFHGNGTASSLRDVTNALTRSNHTYAYDLQLDKPTETAMEEIRELIQKIDEGPGVIVMYDMGSIKTMLDTLSEEMDVKIRMVQVPVTMIGIDIARKCVMDSDIDSVYHATHLNSLTRYEEKEKLNKIIVTLCETGDGGATQLKHYIDQYSKLRMKTFPLAVSNRKDLIKEIINLKKTYDIHCFVGTFDPKLYGIPFISISKVFSNPKEVLDKILLFEPIYTKTIDYAQIYTYLEETLVYTPLAKIKSTLPGVIDELSIFYELDESQKIGLFMHIVSLIENLLAGRPSKKNKDMDRILRDYNESYKNVSRILKVLEKTFNIMINNHEVATIIMVLEKLS